MGHEVPSGKAWGRAMGLGGGERADEEERDGDGDAKIGGRAGSEAGDEDKGKVRALRKTQRNWRTRQKLKDPRFLIMFDGF